MHQSNTFEIGIQIGNKPNIYFNGLHALNDSYISLMMGC